MSSALKQHSPVVNGKLRSQKTVAFADLWYETQHVCGARAPNKADIPMRELAPFMANLALVSFDDKGDAKYELFGTRLVEIAGIDLTGQYVHDTLDEKARRQRERGIADFHAKFGDDALRARWSVGKATTTSGRTIEIEDLALPYFDGNPAAMRHMNFATVLGTMDYGEGVSGIIAADEMIWFNAAVARPSWLTRKA